MKHYYLENTIEAGLDEAGRGCLAGPVFAGAVILDPKNIHPDLNDSKQINEKNRNLLRIWIEENAISYSVATKSAKEIDTLNILKASILAMHDAVSTLSINPAHLLVDGNRFIPYQFIPHTCIIKGDAKFSAIAAASILAKTYRDDYMRQIHEECPLYDWQQNKGYPTVKHRQAIKEFGTTKYHRHSFKMQK